MLPPRPQRGDGERGGVVIAAHADPPGVGRDVIHPIGDGLADRGVGEVVHVDGDGLAFGLPLPASVLVAADQLLLFGVPDGFTGSLEPESKPHVQR